MGVEKILTIAVVDDDAEVRESYKSVLARRPEVRFVGEAADGRAGVALNLDKRPDVLLMDLRMPVMSGPDAIKAICERVPGACVVALTTFEEHADIVEALCAGASGYLTKDARADELIDAIHQAVAGDMPLSAGVRRALAKAAQADGGSTKKRVSNPMTPRETELVGCIVRGMTNRQIASALYLSEGSVKQYLQKISNNLTFGPVRASRCMRYNSGSSVWIRSHDGEGVKVFTFGNGLTDGGGRSVEP